MTSTKLADGTEIFCIKKPEAKMLDYHVDGYLQHGITINDGDVIFDVGANIGVFGIRAVNSFSNVKVYAFEPIPEILAVLKSNAAKFAKDRFIVLPYGASNENTTATFSYFPNTPALSTAHPEMWNKNPQAFSEAVKSTINNPPPQLKWMRFIPASFSGLIAKFLQKGKVSVTCNLRTISSVIKEEKVSEIDLLKIDCEGAELQALQGIEQQDWNKINKVVVEVHDTENRLQIITGLLQKNGFTKIVKEKEKGLENTQLFNLFATRI